VDVKISASIGENRVTIFGYTAPKIRVELSSQNVFDVTFSDSEGYYLFDKTLLPKNPGELCLSSLDDSGRRSLPTCIPAPPATNYHTDIGPIILPPTITLNSVDASGQSIPNSTVEIHFYQVKDNAPVFVKPAEAFALPVYSTQTDSTGNYSFSLPTAYQSNYRLYSTVKYSDNFSPKSNTLLYLLPTQNYTFIVVIFSLSIFIFLYLLFNYFKHKKHYYPAIFSYPLSLKRHIIN